MENAAPWRPPPMSVYISPMQIGIDLGGTKMEAIGLDADTLLAVRRRVATPRDDYAGTLDAVAHLVAEIERETGRAGSVGVGIPGVVAHATGLVKNANSTWLNGRPLLADLEARLARRVRIANDANCFTLSEAIDGAGQGAETVFGVILGTGVGGGIAIRGRIHEGPNQIAGEWGHNPLPWMTDEERASAPPCYCGKTGCVETFLSGPGFERDHTLVGGAPAVERGDRPGRRGRRPPRRPDARAVPRPAGPRARRSDQPARPGRDRPRWRDVQRPRPPRGGRRDAPALRLLGYGGHPGRAERPRRLEWGAWSGVALARMSVGCHPRRHYLLHTPDNPAA